MWLKVKVRVKNNFLLITSDKKYKDIALTFEQTPFKNNFAENLMIFYINIIILIVPIPLKIYCSQY